MDSQRNLFCPNYDACLHLVVRKGWDGWSCRQCPLREFQVNVPEARDFAHSRPRSQDGS